MTTSHFEELTMKIAHLLPAVDAIAKETPLIQDARGALAALALREKAPVTQLINYFLKQIPEQTFHCERCHADVPLYEFAGKMCLDCVQASYEAYFGP